MRKFSGFGIPTNIYIRTQKEKGTDRYFTNLAIELALFGLEKENGFFDWKWIDRRRDSSLSAHEVLRFAPLTWQQWVRNGSAVLEKLRRKVAKYKCSSKEEQLAYSSADDAGILDTVINYFAQLNRHPFEGISSLIAQRVLGGQFLRGWVTKRSGDGGVDFVSRLDLGSDFSVTSVIVLGQAKCISRTSCIGGKDLARIVARLQWLCQSKRGPPR